MSTNQINQPVKSEAIQIGSPDGPQIEFEVPDGAVRLVGQNKDRSQTATLPRGTEGVPSSDLAAEDRAVRNLWPITAEMRKLSVDTCVRIMVNEANKPNVRLEAGRVLAKFYELNLKATALDRGQWPPVTLQGQPTYEVDTLSQFIDSLKSPEDAQAFLELFDRSGFGAEPSENGDRSKPTAET